MKRSEMVKKMALFWRGYESVNEVRNHGDMQTLEDIEYRMHGLLEIMEELGMSAPNTKQIWEEEE